MKHSLKVVVLAGMFASICFWASKRPTVQYFSSLALQNIEALTNNEYPSGNIDCIGYGSVECPFGNMKVKYVFQEF